MPNLFSLEMHLLVMLQRNYWKILHKVTNFCTVVPYESKMTMFLLSIQHFIIFVTMLCSGLTKKKKPKIIWMIWLLKVMFTFVVSEKDFGVCIAIVSDS